MQNNKFVLPYRDSKTQNVRLNKLNNIPLITIGSCTVNTYDLTVVIQLLTNSINVLVINNLNSGFSATATIISKI